MNDIASCYTPAELEDLEQRGVLIPDPRNVFVGREVEDYQIAPGAVLHPFTRLEGADTRVDAGAVLGPGGPVTVMDSHIGSGAVVGELGPVTLREVTCGPGTVLGCGVAEESVFLGKEVDDPAHTTGYGFRVRKGSLYEEDANSAQHTDTKMTVLLPWVTLGSNLNWCDILVSGGVGPGLGQFSEIGSGAVHFNFTPRGDKASASALGNVVDGVFLDRPRLFLGGNTSVIGPCTADFGALTGAGARVSRHLHAGLNAGDPPPQADPDFDLEVYGSVKRLYESQVRYIAQLVALEAWYRAVRAEVARGDRQRESLYERGRAVVARNIGERIKQLGGLAGRLEQSIRRLEQRTPHDPRLHQHRTYVQRWPTIEARLREHTAAAHEPPPALLDAVARARERHGATYTAVIRDLPPTAVQAGRTWLYGIAGTVAAPELLDEVPLVGVAV